MTGHIHRQKNRLNNLNRDNGVVLKRASVREVSPLALNEMVIQMTTLIADSWRTRGIHAGWLPTEHPLGGSARSHKNTVKRRKRRKRREKKKVAGIVLSFPYEWLAGNTRADNTRCERSIIFQALRPRQTGLTVPRPQRGDSPSRNSIPRYIHTSAYGSMYRHMCKEDSAEEALDSFVELVPRICRTCPVGSGRSSAFISLFFFLRSN